MDNKRFVKISYRIKEHFRLTFNQYALLDLIYFYSTNPRSQVAGWCYATKEHLGKCIDVSRKSASNIINQLEAMGLIVKSPDGRHLKTTDKWNATYFSQWEESSHNDEKKVPTEEGRKFPHDEKKVPTSIDNRKDSKVETVKKEEIVLPFNSVNFINAWKRWKKYKAGEFRFKFKTMESEQAALNGLARKGETEEACIAIIMQSMEAGWKGLFELKDKKNERTPSKQQGDIFSAESANETLDILLARDSAEEKY